MTTAPIDKQALRQKYLPVRNKRLRPEGNGQYLAATGSLAHFVDNPHLPVRPRARARQKLTTLALPSSAAALPA